MKPSSALGLAFGVVGALVACAHAQSRPPSVDTPAAVVFASQTEAEIRLPKPQTDGRTSVEQAIAMRRSVRRFAPEPLAWGEIGQLAWAAQGITDTVRGRRAAPSAGGLHPMEAYIVTPDGIFHYVPNTHEVVRLRTGDHRAALSAASGPPYGSSANENTIKQTPCIIALTAIAERMQPTYKGRTQRYILIEAGHIAENVLLQAVALGLVGVPIGGFTDEKIGMVLGLKGGEEVVYLLAVGRPRRQE